VRRGVKSVGHVWGGGRVKTGTFAEWDNPPTTQDKKT